MQVLVSAVSSDATHIKTLACQSIITFTLTMRTHKTAGAEAAHHKETLAASNKRRRAGEGIQRTVVIKCSTGMRHD